jgi:hypothetical protein
MRVDIAIIFVGLIVQVNQPWSFDNTAVLPKVPGHIAEMVIPHTALANPLEIEQLPNKRIEKGQVIIDLNGIDVRLRGTRGWFNRRTREYKESVPSLKKVGGCRNLQDAVRRREQNRLQQDDGTPALLSFVDIRGGRMSPHSYAPSKLSFEETDFQERCAACSVLYEAALHGNTATLVFHVGEAQSVNETKESKATRTHEVHLRRGAELLVRNIPHDYLGDGHFPHAYVVFQQCGVPLAPGPTKPCRKPICVQKTFDWENSGRGAAFSADCTIDDG